MKGPIMGVLAIIAVAVMVVLTAWFVVANR